MRQKIINVTYRKESIAFPDWLKYEIVILNEDGSEDTIPAYGKDLEDAISRVKHDKRVEVVEKSIEKSPIWVWLLIWISYMGVISSLAVEYSSPIIVSIGLSGAVLIGLYFQWWIRNRNVDKY
jgi:hypothetical protein